MNALPPPQQITSQPPDVISERGQCSTLLQQWLRQFVRYGVVGILNTALHAAVFFSLVAIGFAQAMGNFLAFLVAVTFSFFANARFTFSQRPSLAKFLKMSVVMAVLSICCGIVGDALAVNPILTFVVYCAVSYVLGFLLTRFFVFSK